LKANKNRIRWVKCAALAGTRGLDEYGFGTRPVYNVAEKTYPVKLTGASIRGKKNGRPKDGLLECVTNPVVGKSAYHAAQWV